MWGGRKRENGREIEINIVGEKRCGERWREINSTSEEYYDK